MYGELMIVVSEIFCIGWKFVVCDMGVVKIIKDFLICWRFVMIKKLVYYIFYKEL